MIFWMMSTIILMVSANQRKLIDDRKRSILVRVVLLAKLFAWDGHHPSLAKMEKT